MPWGSMLHRNAAMPRIPFLMVQIESTTARDMPA